MTDITVPPVVIDVDVTAPAPDIVEVAAGVPGPPGPTGPPGPVGPVGPVGPNWGTVDTVAALPPTGATAVGAQYLVTGGLGLHVAVNTPTGWRVDPVSDTGWQPITTLGVNGWSLALAGNKIRRFGNKVRLKLDATAPATWNAVIIATAPAGFTYGATEGGFSTQQITDQSAVPRSTTTATVGINPNFLRALGATVASGQRCAVGIEYTTDDPWPIAAP